MLAAAHFDLLVVAAAVGLWRGGEGQESGWTRGGEVGVALAEVEQCVESKRAIIER